MRRLGVAFVAVTATLAGSAVLVAPATGAPATNGAYCAVSLPSKTFVCADSPAALLRARSSQPQTGATQFLIARLYDNSNYDTSAGYLNVYAGGDCTVSTGNVDYSLSDLGTWSNRVSSFESFGNCATRLWSGTSYTGTAFPSSGYEVDSSYVGGAFNDKARSTKFS